MPTISQLPPAGSISAADELPISQSGSVGAVSVGSLLASTQPAIILDTASLLGRVSIGSGSPEEVDIGIGITLSDGTLMSDGLDHSRFPTTSSLSAVSDLVISDQGSPMLMQASLLRGLFSAGANVAIDPNGVISASADGTVAGTVVSGGSIGELQTISILSAQDLVAVSHAGSDYAIAYSSFLDGITIDQAQLAGPAANSDTIWVAQSSNVMASQNFSAIWVWITNNLPSYKAPVVEITTNTNIDTTVHNGRILVCSQAVTLTPLTANMGSGFQCRVINASTGNITLGSGFVSSNGSLVLTPWQSATLCCATYSAGTIAYAAMPTAAAVTTITAIPGQVTGLASTGVTATTISVSWQSPSSGGVVASYVVQFRPTGTTSWSVSTPIVSATTYQITGLQAATSFDIAVVAQNTTGAGPTSAVLTVVTTVAAQATVPSQVSGLVATPISSSVIQLSWAAQTGSSAASSFTVQYRVTGSSIWIISGTGIVGTGATVSGLLAATSYDFSVIGVNSAGAAPASATVTAATAAQSTLPAQVSGLTATPTSSSAIQLNWLAQSGNGAATSFTIHYRVTGSSSWTSSIAGVTGTGDSISGLSAATSYDFSIIGVNSAGAGSASATVTAVTLAASASVSSITFNLLPGGTYSHGSGAIGVNAQVSPAASPIQFGFSLSSTTPPSSWTTAVLVNTNLWGAYVNTPATAGTWFTWAEGLDGSALSVSSSSFVVQ